MIENITLIADNEAANVDSINTRLEKANTNFNSLNSTKADKTTVYTKQETDIKLTEQQTYTDTHRTYTLTHTKLGTVHTLSDLPTGQGIYQCQFIAQADYTEGDTFTGYAAKPTGEETILPDKAFVKGDIVSVLVDTVNKKLGFKLGGSGVNQTLPPQIRSFAVTSGNSQNKLSWLLPVDTSTYEGLVIIKKVGSAPTKISDGTKIELSKTATSYTDTGLTNDTTYYYRAFPYNAKKQYQTELTGSVVNGTPKAFSLPTYTGQHAIFGDINEGRIEMYTTGTLTLSPATYDMFAVGGGGAGYAGGGGGGFTNTQKNINVPDNISLTVFIGSGSTGVSSTQGGHSTIRYGDIVQLIADGGKLGNPISSAPSKGGDGGSGGGGYSGGVGGFDGSDGTGGNYGIGQHTTTRAFGETTGKLYAGGGGGIPDSNHPYTAGGSGGGGSSNLQYVDGSAKITSQNGTPNTGGGGGGGGTPTSSGGSGIAIIRWKRN